MMYNGGTPTISMPMMSATTIQKMVVVWVVPCGTYLKMRGKRWNLLETRGNACFQVWLPSGP